MGLKLKKLIEYIETVQTPDIRGSVNMDINNICVDSRKVRQGDMFIALEGSKADGHDYIEDALSRGADVIITRKEVEVPRTVTRIIVKNSRRVLSVLSNVFYDFPSKKIKLTGITGTNGKSTIAYITQQILLSSGRQTGRLGTLGYNINQRQIPSSQTTPSPPELQEYLARMAAEGAGCVVMEVSSHALDQDRVRGLDFDQAVFTNISLDHLDYHLSMSKYIETKYRFFEEIISDKTTSIINADSSHGLQLCRVSPGKTITYGFKKTADIRAESVVLAPQGSEFDLILSKDIAKYHIKTDLMGRFNISNLLACIGICLDSGLTLDEIAPALVDLGPIPGRLERIECGQDFTVLVDFAHTPDAIKLVLTELKAITKARLIIVFGCGGDRDKSKRPLMGKIATSIADKTIITSDNPRTEDPLKIANEIAVGVTPDGTAKSAVPKGTVKSTDYEVVLDRYKAIKKAFQTARKGDLVIIAGKGHESAQILKNTIIPFDDRQVARELLASADKT